MEEMENVASISSLSVPVANQVISESVEEEEAEHIVSCAVWSKITDNQKQ